MKGLLILVLFSWSHILFGQIEPIHLVNPSFEGPPADGTLDGSLPVGWYDCGFPGETVPDVHPQADGGFFQVFKEAHHESSYMGMVVRENDTWEMISQRLSSALKSGKCYEFSIFLARSEIYLSPSRLNSEKVNYATPAKLRIWGGAGFCNRNELLAESSLIVNTRWLEYNFRFEPKQNHTHIVFEAFYKTPTPFPYNGNILLDNASAIIPVPCNIEKPEVAVVTPKPEQPIPQPPPQVSVPKPQPQTAGKTEDSIAKKQRILVELDRKKIKKDQIIRINQLYFKADSSSIEEKSFAVLNEIYEFLAGNPDVVVEIGGHTNGIPTHEYCDKLSTARAKAVADYLVNKGIMSNRLQYRGYGKRIPIESNQTVMGRQKNQRVEIKILSFNG
jgi:outer membrane protein OmpA-like peptidoglycan-associated protein